MNRDLPGRATVLRGGAVLAVSLVALVVAAVGAITLVAELNATWGWYFLMERSIALATPVTLVLLGLSVLACFSLIVLSPSE
jgi:hypothetical protein